MRAVLDANVLIAALLSRTGAPAKLLERWLFGDFELVVSERLIGELERTLARPKLRQRVSRDLETEFVRLLRELGEIVDDPPRAPAVRSRDPGDDYLLALATAARATLVSGDGHLLELGGSFPIVAPRAFLEQLD